MKKAIRICFAKAVLLLTISFLLLQSGYAQNVVKFGNSYVNLSKRSVGGTVQPGDTLEIRTNYFFPPGYNAGNIYFVRYVDNVPTRTTYVVNQLRQITNEGLTYLAYSDAPASDPGTYLGLPPVGQFNVKINIGTTAAAPVDNTSTNATGAGRITAGTNLPRVAGGTLVTTAFRVRVTGAVGDTVVLGAGRLLFKKTNNILAADTVVNTIQYKILISNNDPICNNAIGKNFVAEAGGTFDSSTTQNRGYGPTFLIPNYTYRLLTPAVQINDGFYTIVNNLSPQASTFQNAEKRPNCITPAGGPPPVPAACANRMFNGHWDIIGDHTGSATPAGNTPKAVGTRGGYMLVVNADYATSEAYRQNITGLCPNTSYEFSLWVRNVCTNCGIDINGTSTFGPGVYPNLTFAIDDLDRYSTGQIDTLGWIKKGFLFKTGPAQTAITISIRNNASGGGGNDWAIDDIALVTCNPNLNMLPSGNANVCLGNQVDISCAVRSFFNNYTHWRWEKSIDNGATWSLAASGIGSPLFIGGQYQYTSALPSFLADSAAHNDRYRFIVASTASNLTDTNCNFIASTMIVVWVNNCGTVLPTKFISFNGEIENGYAKLDWTTENEASNVTYEIEKSMDMVAFNKLGSMERNGGSSGMGIYTYNDPQALNGNTYYRIRMIEGANTKYSKTILLSSSKLNYDVRSLINPFVSTITFDLIAPEAGKARLKLIDAFGRTVLETNESYSQGLNTIRISNLAILPAGFYSLQILIGKQVINKRVVKANP